MNRRHFLTLSSTTLAAACVSQRPTPLPRTTSASAFASARRWADLPFGKIAYVERGQGEAALFLHGAPLNGFQWCAALESLAPFRRCVAPDFMGLGYSQTAAQQSLAAADQCSMLVAFCDALGLAQVDVVASDSGGAVAQLLVARHPQRVRTLLLTNCDVEPDSPPAKVKQAIDLARAGTLAAATAAWLTDGAKARSTFGAAVYRDPNTLTDERIEYYASPLVSSPLRQAQYHAFHLALEPNPLAGLDAVLRRSAVPMRVVWGTSDDIFSLADAEYLDRTFPRSRGIRRVAGGKLFFPEEFPEVITEEALRLWRG
jgi:pimeloyl-ACP methyl ester carboxylesterase